jgi:tripartite-type tricarboxylate transporter receptor subunit TctC
MFDFVVDSIPQLKAGNIRSYAVLAKTRISGAPKIPTLDEAGLPGLYVSSWQAIFAPKHTPENVITKLNEAIVEALSDPAVRRLLGDLAQEIPPRDRHTPGALRELQKTEAEKWWPIIKTGNIKLQ